jgi:hypothetical protein
VTSFARDLLAQRVAKPVQVARHTRFQLNLFGIHAFGHYNPCDGHSFANVLV